MLGAKYIAKGIFQNKSLEHLNIKANAIGDEGIMYIAEALQCAPKLKHLDCSQNEIAH